MKVSLLVIGLTMLLVGNSLSGQQEDLDHISSRLKNFEFNRGLAGTLQASSINDYLQLDDDQQRQIAKVKKKYVKQADKIRDSEELEPVEPEERLLRMEELRKPLDEELERILKPHQKKLLARYGLYNRVQYEGLVNSMLRGAIAKHFELSDGEIREIKAEAEELYQEYRETRINAQKRAIAKLIDSYPAEKQDQLKAILEPMLDGNGLFYDNVDSTFKITNPEAGQEHKGSYIVPRQIDKEKP